MNDQQGNNGDEDNDNNENGNLNENDIYLEGADIGLTQKFLQKR